MHELEHSDARKLIDAAVDGELGLKDLAQFDMHLTTCGACSTEHARIAAISAAIRKNASRYTAPAELRTSLSISLAPQPAASAQVVRFPANRVRPRLLPAAGGFAVGAALAAGIAVMVTTADVESRMTDSIVSAHVRALQPGHLTDVQVSDQHQVKPWFDGRIDFAPQVKELSDQGFELVGGRLDYVDGREAAVIVYRRKLHVIDLFVTRADHPTTHPGGFATHATASGYNVVYWSDNGQDCWAVSDGGINLLQDFAGLWKSR